MRNINAFVFIGASFVFVHTVDAQHNSLSKPGSPIHSLWLANPNMGHHPAPGDLLRGGGLPVNDNCASVSTVVLPVGGSITFTGDNTNATEDGDYVPGDDLEGTGPVVWHKFSISECQNVTISYCGISPAYTYVMLILAHTCPATFDDLILDSGYDTEICGDGNPTISFVSVPAGEYYLPVLLWPDSNAIGPYTLQVSASPCPPGPVNDECAQATPLTSNANCEQTYFTTVGATESLAPIFCGEETSPNAKDVWFSFVCTSAEQTIGVAGYNSADAVIELFSGSCGNLTSMGCADATYPYSLDETTTEQLDQAGLTVGSTYYVRVYDWGHFSPEHNFAICLTEGSGNNVGISELKKTDVLSVYPNPGNGNFNLQYTGGDGLGTIEVFDLTGRSVYSVQSQFTSGTTRSLDLGSLAQGQYSLRLTINGVRSQQNLVVQ